MDRAAAATISTLVDASPSLHDRGRSRPTSRPPCFGSTPAPVCSCMFLSTSRMMGSMAHYQVNLRAAPRGRGSAR